MTDNIDPDTLEIIEVPPAPEPEPPPKLTTAQLKATLAAAEAELATADASFEQAAYDAVTEASAEAPANLARVNAGRQAGRERVATLRTAVAKSVKLEKGRDRRRTHLVQESQARAAHVHLVMRDKAAAKLVEAFAECVTHFHTVVDHAVKARNACPAGRGAAYLTGSLTTAHEVREAIAGELWRIGGVGIDFPQARALTFPAMKAADLRAAGDPKGTTPLADRLATDRKWIDSHNDAYVAQLDAEDEAPEPATGVFGSEGLIT